MAVENVQQAILQAKIEGILKKIIVRTNADNVMYDDSTTLATKLAEILTDVGTLAKSSEVTSQIQAAIDGLINGAPGTYDTLQEIAAYIEEHKEAAEALQAAVGNKLDSSVFDTFKNSVEKLGSLAGKSKVSESDLDEGLSEKINAASEGNHSHSNKEDLDGITSEKVTSWDGAADKAHEHGNKATLDKLTEAKLTELEGKSKIYFSKEQPETLKEGDLWFQLIGE